MMDSKKSTFLQSLKEQVSTIMPKGNCFICNNETSFKCADDYICSDCIRHKLPYKVGTSVSKLTKAEIQSCLDTGKVATDVYSKKLWQPTKKIDNYIEIDETTKRWRVVSDKSKKIYSFDDVIGFELLEDGSSVIKGGLGMATVGGALFGAIGGAASIGAGATVGSILGKKKKNKVITQLKVKITINDINSPVIYIVLLNNKTKFDSTPYKKAYLSAQEILSVLSVMVERKSQIISSTDQNTVNQVAAISPADEIRKYKSLLDEGIITSEEFETKKKELL